MKKVKMAVWGLIILFFAVLIYQNQAFFLNKQSLGLNLLIGEYHTPEVRIVYLAFAFLIFGLLLGEYFLLVHSLRNKKKIKTMTAEVDAQKEKIAALEEELRTFRPDPPPAVEAAPDADAKTVVMKPEDAPPVSEPKP
jgi:uncharacterized integral membrane protein